MNQCIYTYFIYLEDKIQNKFLYEELLVQILNVFFLDVAKFPSKNDCPSLHSDQQCSRASACPQPGQKKVLSHSFHLIGKKQFQGLSWQHSSKASTCQCRRCRFDHLVRKGPWRRKWQPTPVFLLGKSYGRKILAGYSPCSCKRVMHNLATKRQ